MVKTSPLQTLHGATVVSSTKYLVAHAGGELFGLLPTDTSLRRACGAHLNLSNYVVPAT
jgi:hypothetical protein